MHSAVRRSERTQIHSVFNQPSILEDLLPHLQNQARIQLELGTTSGLDLSGLDFRVREKGFRVSVRVPSGELITQCFFASGLFSFASFGGGHRSSHRVRHRRCFFNQHVAVLRRSRFFVRLS